jgi:outer membrane beta-barrel protein
MAARVQCLFLAGLLAAPWAAQLPAQTTDEEVLEGIVEPGLERREIPRRRVPSRDFEAGLFVGAMSVEDFGTNVAFGLSLGYHITEDFFVEGVYGRTDTSETSFERLTGSVELLTDDERELSYYNVSLGYNLFPGEVFLGRSRSFNSAFYLIAGAGNTDFAGQTQFTFNVGAGFRLSLYDWLALRFDARDHIFELDLLGDEELLHNLALTMGVTFFF